MKFQCRLSHTKLPVSWVLLQGPFTGMCPKEIYAKISANTGRRQIGCTCLSASKRSCCIWVMLLQKQHRKDRWVELAASIKSQKVMISQLKRKSPPSWQNNLPRLSWLCLQHSFWDNTVLQGNFGLSNGIASAQGEALCLAMDLILPGGFR